MAKVAAIQQDGIIEKAFSNAIFTVRLENNHLVKAHISGKIRKHYIKIFPDDKVRIELSPYDLTRGRIVYRY